MDDLRACPCLGLCSAAQAAIYGNHCSNECAVQEAPRELEAWRYVVELATSRQVPLVPLILELDIEGNIRRLQNVDRVGKKLTDPAALLSYLAADTIQYPDVPETFVLDVTRLEPMEAAARVQQYVERVRAILRPATQQHLELR